MQALKPLLLSGKEVLPLIEGGKGISISTGVSAGAWAAAGGIGTFSAVNADSYDENGALIPIVYKSKTRRERHQELIAYGIAGGIAQAKIAHDMASGNGRIHMNVLWEMGGCEHILRGVLEGAKGLVHGITCGAGMPYKLGEIAAQYGVYFYPIVSSARAFNALWKRSYHKVSEWLGAVVYEDPWKAGGHNGISNSEDPNNPEDPYPRVKKLRELMNQFGLAAVPIIVAGGVWHLKDWDHWINNQELGPIAFQFGTRPLLTQESPISQAWKEKLLQLQEGDVILNRFSPTGFYSSAVKNEFLVELMERSERQVAYTLEPLGEHTTEFPMGTRGRVVYLVPEDKVRAEQWVTEGYTIPMKTPESTLIFVRPEKSKQILKDQIECMGCLSQCRFSNWSQEESGTTGHRPDPRSFCIQKTLQDISHHQGQEDIKHNLMFSGHNAYRFATDPFYKSGFIPTVQQLIDRILTGA